MHLRLILAAAFAVGLASAAQAQVAQVIATCGAGVTLPAGPGGKLFQDTAGLLCINASPATTAGTSGGTAQSVQGVNGGVPQATTIRAAGTNRSATIGTTAVTLMPANASRQGWKIKNDSTGDLWINFDATATATAGGGNIKIVAGGYLTSEPGFIETGAMSAIGSAAGLAITAREH